MKMFSIFVFLFLTSCAGAQVISSSQRTVVINGGYGQVAMAQKLADQECAKNNRYARLSRHNPDTYQFVYDCVE